MQNFGLRLFVGVLAVFASGMAMRTVALASDSDNFSTFTVYNCSNSADGVDTFSYNLNDSDKVFSYDSGSVGKGSSRTFSCEGDGGCQVQYGSLFGQDVWETVGEGAKRYVLSKSSGFLGMVATIYVGDNASVCAH